MRITIHRGIDQIGGCITEIATNTSKVIIDLGHNLPDGEGVADDRLANKQAIEALTKGCSAVIYSHYHGDHIDLYKYVPDNVPQYVGGIAKEVMLCKNKRLARIPNSPVSAEDIAKLEKLRTYQVAKKIDGLGDITVTPFVVSHSACDAYMFLIEADGKRILHTGDFREHGYIGKGLLPTIEKYILRKPVDVLITEGTMLSRLDEKVRHENDLKIEAIKLLKQRKYTFVLCSSTDIDRLATFHGASKAAGRIFLCDDYQKEVLDIFSTVATKANSPYNFDNAYFYKHGHQKQFALLKEKVFCMLIRGSRKFSFVQELIAELGQENCLLIYSMWSGYIKSGKNQNQEYVNLYNMFDNRESLHTSGHASAYTLAKLCNTVNPQAAIIPIHSEQSDNFSNLDISEELKSKVITATTTVGGIEIVVC